MRSGDKGHLFNVAVIARRPQCLPWLRAANPGGRRAVVPAPARRRPAASRLLRGRGFHALNFVVHDALEGGINASTQLDPAAKGMGQMLLRFPVSVPAALAAQLAATAH